ncbi:MarR family winged helix-turn-helix transcriptional regulator [Enterococcus sp. DIV0187]|uniref:MarR family winged helix-turn-helix transcriptional regulator n=1 Tax=Enterococcus sp. DIV0187 TaxID=2774644 RepID=UPI003F21687E
MDKQNMTENQLREEVYRLFFTTYHRLSHPRESGISVEQYMVLQEIERAVDAGVSVLDIVRQTGMPIRKTRQALTVLKQYDCVKSVVCAHDKRERRIHLTDVGAEFFQQLVQEQQDFLRENFSRIDKEELGHLLRLFQSMNASNTILSQEEEA